MPRDAITVPRRSRILLPEGSILRRGSDCSIAFSNRRQKEITVNKTLGIILIVLGLVGLAWGGFSYTTREKVVDLGPIHATREKTHNVALPPIAGALALIGGVVLLMTARKT
jgi:hypothetical protein